MKIASSLLGLLLLFSVRADSLHAAAPADQLVRLVPENVGFCVVVRDLRSHAEALRQSPFIADFCRSPLGRELLASQELEKVVNVEKELKKLFDVDWAQVRDDILGDAVVLAYRPGPPDRPDQEQDLFLVHARNPQL